MKDSKALGKMRRYQIYRILITACEFGEGWVAPGEIDKIGLSEAMRLGTRRALEALGPKPDDKIIFDGNINYCDPKYFKSTAVIDADELFPIVSAASIYAKVTRDKYMAELPERYRMYEFGRHVGYGTALHAELLKQFGLSDLHRRSFGPVKALL